MFYIFFSVWPYKVRFLAKQSPNLKSKLKVKNKGSLFRGTIRLAWAIFYYLSRSATKWLKLTLANAFSKGGIANSDAKKMAASMILQKFPVLLSIGLVPILALALLLILALALALADTVLKHCL